MITRKEYALIITCIDFLCQYEGKMRGHHGDFNSTAVSMTGTQLQQWKDLFYPELVQSDIINDDRFFYPDGTKPNYGIGNDGIMKVYDYCNIMYQLYKKAVLYSENTVDQNNKVLACVRMLEPYTFYFMSNWKDAGVVTLSADHMNRWKNDFYPNLVKAKIIPDTSFFDPEEKNKNYGIGEDGSFYGAELLHFLYECYRYIGKECKIWE